MARKHWLGIGILAITVGAVGAGSALAFEGGNEPSGPAPITSIDDIDPKTCNWVHNIHACEGQTPPGGGTAPSALEVIDLAREDLARRLGVQPSAFVVLSVEERTWPNSSLGHPQPGEFYAEVLTPGFRIVILQSGVAEYVYHTGHFSRVVFVG